MGNKNSEFNNLDTKKEIILSLGVYELRGLARVLGVKSPTTRKREELISLILDIVENNDNISVGEIEKKGRPFKALSSVKNIVDVLSTKSDEKKIVKYSTYDEIVAFNQEMPSFTLQSSDIFPSSGVFRKGNGFGYFVDSASKKMVFIAPEQVQKYGIETGDFLECAVFEINNGRKCFVKKINKINGENAEVYEAKVFDDYAQVLPEKQIVCGKNILLGGRNVIVASSPVYMIDFVKPLLSSLKAEKKVFLGVNVCFEDKMFATNNLDFFSLTSNYDENIVDGYDKIIDAINFVERMKQANENVVLFVSDFGNVLNCLDNNFQEDGATTVLGHNEKSVLVAKKLISLAMAKSNGKNVTSIFVCNKFDVEDLFVKNELIKVSNIID